MHYYACPYCFANPSAVLSLKIVPEVKCKYQMAGWPWNKEKTCKEKHKCKEVMECEECSSWFKPTKKFLRDQKRKIKDG